MTATTMTTPSRPTAAAMPTAAPDQAAAPTRRLACRSCGAALDHTFADLGTSPLCQRHVTAETFDRAENFYPLHVYVCDQCWLVQLPEYVGPGEIFDDQYAYFSSFAMLEHGKRYVEQIIPRIGLKKGSRV